MDQNLLAEDARRLVDDAESLLQHAVQGAGQDYTKARHRLEQSVLAAKQSLAAFGEEAMARGKEAAGASDRYVRSHPWESIGVAAAVGLAFGLLLGRR